MRGIVSIGKAAILAGMLMAGANSARADQASDASFFPDQDGVLAQLRPVLRGFRTPARLYYGTDECSGEISVPFPKLKLKAPTVRSSALAAVRTMFDGNDGVAVSQDASGMIRIRIGRIPDAFFRTHIGIIRFGTESRYNSAFAMSGVENTTEMLAAATHLKLKRLVRPWVYAVQQPMAGVPHLPKTLQNQTADQALDTIAWTFGTIISYGFCNRTGLFDNEEWPILDWATTLVPINRK